MDREQLNNQSTDENRSDDKVENMSAKEFAQEPAEPSFEQTPYTKEGTYTAVSSGQPSASTEPAKDFTAPPAYGYNPYARAPQSVQYPASGAPQSSQTQPSAKPPKKSGGGHGILIAVLVTVIITAMLLTSAFGLVIYALIDALNQEKVPAGPSPDQEVSVESYATPGEEPSKPVVEDETTPAPDSYDPDAWYNSGDLDDPNAIVNVVAKCNPSVVAISTDSGSGSGIIWSSDGYIVTNNHVIEGAGAVTVMLCNNEEYSASVIDSSAENDLALLRINVTGLLPVSLGDSDDLRVGETVIAIGNPLGILANSVTDGILSAKAREITVEGQAMNLMQISAQINPGNSGGGCFDIDGNLIGVVNAKTSATGIEGLGFAIPVNTAKSVIGEMIRNDDTVLQKGIGVTGCYEITEENYQEYASDSFIKQVEKLNGAPLYGLYTVSDGLVDYVDEKNTFENGDILKSINGKEVKTIAEINEIVNEGDVGDELTIVVIRMVQTGGFMNYRYSLEEYSFKIRIIEMYK